MICRKYEVERVINMREILFRGKDKLGIWHYGYFHADIITGDDKYYINSRISVNNPNYVEIDKDTVGQFTEINDIDGDMIFEGMKVCQKGTVMGDDTDLAGYVEMLEGCWVINNRIDNAIPLWSETAENKILEDM